MGSVCSSLQVAVWLLGGPSLRKGVANLSAAACRMLPCVHVTVGQGMLEEKQGMVQPAEQCRWDAALCDAIYAVG